MIREIRISHIAKALLSRLIFGIHGVVTVYLLYMNEGYPVHWALLIPIALLLVETVVTLVVRRGKEYRYFWPSGFLYIMTIIPAIWIMEMHLFEDREKASNHAKDIKAGRNSSIILDPTANEKAHFGVSDEVLAKKVGELGLIIGIIIGRWLMPRGEITRDQLSALLLNYVGNAADIIELFETFNEPNTADNRSITIGVIAVYTWSIFQFTLVTTATIKDKKQIKDDIETENRKKKEANQLRKNRIVPVARRISGSALRRDMELKRQYIERLKEKKRSDQISKEDRGRGKKKSLYEVVQAKRINEAQRYREEEKMRRRELHGEVFQILVTLLMQDGPFLILRLYLIIQFSISSEMHIFFTCKNAIVSVLLVYRLLILTCKEERNDNEDLYEREAAATKLQNVQLAIMGTEFMESGKIQVA